MAEGALPLPRAVGRRDVCSSGSTDRRSNTRSVMSRPPRGRSPHLRLKGRLVRCPRSTQITVTEYNVATGTYCRAYTRNRSPTWTRRVLSLNDAIVVRSGALRLPAHRDVPGLPLAARRPAGTNNRSTGSTLLTSEASVLPGGRSRAVCDRRFGESTGGPHFLAVRRGTSRIDLTLV